jgi:ribose transport system ATP-binding protein
VTAAPAIRLTGLTKTFGGHRALDDVSLEIPAGTVHGLLGENGSGKSTLIKVLTGVYEPDAGAVLEVAGRPAPLPLAPGAFRALGISVVHQDLGLLPELSVAENMRIAQGIATRRTLVSWRTERRLAGETLRRHGLDIDPAAAVATLSDTERALVAILRAVDELGDSRTLLILDEPTVFLPREGTGRTSVLLVSHDLTEVLEHTARVTVLRDGRLAGTVDSATTDPVGLTELIVGADLAAALRKRADADAPGPQPGPVPGQGLVQVARLVAPRLHGVSFDVGRSEVLGLTGLAGSGYDEVLPALYGAADDVSGDLLVDRDALQLSSLTPARALGAGIVLVPADRRRDGGIAEESVERNMTMPVMTALGSRFRLDRRALQRRAQELSRRYDVRPFDPGKAFGTLSGGNQQKAVLAKWLQTDPRVVLLAEPTQGIDVGAKAFVFDLLRQAAERGASILLASSDYEQLATVCDRVLVLARGHVVAELSGADLTQATLSDRVLSSTRLLDTHFPVPTQTREAS